MTTDRSSINQTKLAIGASPASNSKCSKRDNFQAGCRQIFIHSFRGHCAPCNKLDQNSQPSQPCTGAFCGIHLGSKVLEYMHALCMRSKETTHDRVQQ